jgi:hypothetical protein
MGCAGVADDYMRSRPAGGAHHLLEGAIKQDSPGKTGWKTIRGGMEE